MQARLTESALRGKHDMNWIEEADWKCRHKRQILFAKDSEFLQDVALLLHHQEHRAAVLWACDFAAESVC